MPRGAQATGMIGVAVSLTVLVVLVLMARMAVAEWVTFTEEEVLVRAAIAATDLILREVTVRGLVKPRILVLGLETPRSGRPNLLTMVLVSMLMPGLIGAELEVLKWTGSEGKVTASTLLWVGP